MSKVECLKEIIASIGEKDIDEIKCTTVVECLKELISILSDGSVITDEDDTICKLLHKLKDVVLEIINDDGGGTTRPTGTPVLRHIEVGDNLKGKTLYFNTFTEVDMSAAGGINGATNQSIFPYQGNVCISSYAGQTPVELNNGGTDWLYQKYVVPSGQNWIVQEVLEGGIVEAIYVLDVI